MVLLFYEKDIYRCYLEDNQLHFGYIKIINCRNIIEIMHNIC